METEVDHPEELFAIWLPAGFILHLSSHHFCCVGRFEIC